MTQTATPATFSDALTLVADGAADRDRRGDGIADALAILERAGLLGWNAVTGETRPPAAEELALIRSVARADSSAGRIVDGHFNGTERLAVQAPPELAATELALVRDGLLRVGVWGGDPRAGEGEPARLEPGLSPTGEVLWGEKTFCSGAGCLDRALVLARDGADPAAAPVTVWVDLRDPETVSIDESWYRSSGLRASASHRVAFHATPVLARFGGPGAITLQPWFGRDALRTAASWAGMVDAAVTAAISELAARAPRGSLEELATGRMLAAQRTIDAWLGLAATAMDAAVPDLWDVALHARVAITAAVTTVLDEAARACGSHPFATGGDLDRLRRDLQLFVLQHRLDPGLIRAGAAALERAAPAARPAPERPA